jgi:hypothetical protein
MVVSQQITATETRSVRLTLKILVLAGEPVDVIIRSDDRLNSLPGTQPESMTAAK